MRQYIEKFNPFREPRWRLNRVLSLVDAKPRPARPSRKYDDKYVAAYRRFLLQWRSKPSTQDRLQLFADHAPMVYAHKLYHHQDKEWRWLLEACLLARMSNEEIADQFGTLPEVIDLYEKVFFNVRDRLDQELWICKVITGSIESRQGNREGTLTANQWAMLLKLFGYYGGPEALKVLVSGYKNSGHPKTAREVADWFDEATTTSVRRSAAMVARTYNFDRFSVMQLLEMHVHLVEVQQAATSAGGPTTEIEANIDKMLKELPWTTGRTAAKGLPQPVQPFQTTASELRAEETLCVIRGESPIPDQLPPPDVFKQPKSSLKED